MMTFMVFGLIVIFMISFIGMAFADTNSAKKKLSKAKTKKEIAPKQKTIREIIEEALTPCPLGCMWETEKVTRQYWEGAIKTPHKFNGKIFEKTSWEKIYSDGELWQFVPATAKTRTEDRLRISLIGPDGIIKTEMININRLSSQSIDYLFTELACHIQIKSEEMVKDFRVETEEWNGIYFKSESS